MEEMRFDYQQQQEQDEREQDPCEDSCFLKEHKGYDTCALAGTCLYRQNFGKSVQETYLEHCRQWRRAWKQWGSQ